MTVRDKATFEDPAEYPVGIPYVIVNGVAVIDKRESTRAQSQGAPSMDEVGEMLPPES